MKRWMQKAYIRVTGALENQKGAQAIEWIALAGVVLAIFAAVQTFFKGDEAVGKAVSDTLSKIIQNIAGEGN